MKFWLGTHQPHWLGLASVSLFVSARRLRLRKSFPRALRSWALDSGGFSELSMYGRWKTSARAYVKEVQLWRSEVGKLSWAAIQDWMCEPFITEKTGKTVREHQLRTIASYQKLHALDPSVPWTPVLQGWDYRDYFGHLESYDKAGIDLRTFDVVGIGSVCRRQGTALAETIVSDLAKSGVRLHGFGFKTGGLLNVGHLLSSADSMAWSFGARRRKVRMPGCTHEGVYCNNCLDYALDYRRKIMAAVNSGQRVLPAEWEKS